MPLIIHPTSCCDVCLEPLTYDEPRPPFAIPCGHIFCRECLFTLLPSVCPLCRKPFIPDRSKKLITGALEADEDRTAVDLLQRLVVSWDTEASETDHRTLILELDGWFGSGNTHEPLAKAREVIDAYRSLKSERDNGHISIRQLQHELEQLNFTRANEKDHASAVEQSLLSQVEELNSKAARYEAEIEAFRKVSNTITFRHNPLPRPPEPYPLETLPSYARRYQNTGGDHTNGQSSTEAPSDEYTTSHNPLRPNGTSTIDRKGKGKEVFAPPTPQSPGRRLDRSPSRYPPSSGGSTGWYKNEVIPGASPGQRFVPPSVFDAGHTSADVPHSAPVDGSRKASHEEASAPLDPFTMVAEYLSGYAGGYEEAHGVMQRQTASSSRRPRPSRHMTEPPGPISLPLLEPPEDFYAPARPHPTRARTVGQLVGQQIEYSHPTSDSRKSSRRPRRDIYSSQHVNGRALPAPPSPATAPSYVSSARSGDEWAHHPSVRALPSISSISSTSGPHPTTTMYSATTSAQTTIPPPVPSFDPAPLDTLSNGTTTQLSHNSSRTRHHRRMSDINAVETPWRPQDASPHPPSDFGSSLRRRSAFSAYPTQTITYPTLPPTNQTSAEPDVQRTSVADSFSSWGTVNTANPAPPSTQPIRNSAHFIPAHDVLSVHDLPLRSFEDVEGDAPRRGSLTSDGYGLASSPARLDPIRGLGIGGFDHDTAHFSTPRNLTRASSLSDSVHRSSQSSHSSRASERRRDIYSEASRDSQIAQAPPPVAPEIWYRPELTPTQTGSYIYAQSSSSSRRSSRARHRMSQQPNSTPSSSHWPDARHTITPTPGESNALGLSDITHSPEPRISAPTPVVSARVFLQSFGQDD